MNSKKILVIEDQTGPLDSISYAIRKAVLGEEKALPGHGHSLSSEQVEQDLISRGIDFARCYNEALSFIKDGGNYNLIFLDHRMPYENCSALERTDPDTFSDRLAGIGYGLISLIRQHQQNAKIIGTSSLSKSELREFEKPDYHLDKSSVRTIVKDLTSILDHVGDEENGR